MAIKYHLIVKEICMSMTTNWFEHWQENQIN